jgi:hypothetical protein
VSPLEFNFSAQGIPISVIGRTIPKKPLGNGRFKDLDAELVFDP